MAKQKEIKEFNSRTVVKYVNDVLSECGWEKGYKFRSSEFFQLDTDVTIQNHSKTKQLELVFTLSYRTKTHVVTNNVTWRYTYKNIICLNKNIQTLENDIACKTGDKDDVFGPRFNKKLFVEREYEKKGWRIVK